MSDKTWGVAVVGCGTVGGGTALLLHRDIDLLKERSGLNLELKYIVDLNFDHAKTLGLDESLFTTDINTALEDESVKIVVELVGGITIAKTFMEKALKAGKHVVTANKALLAHHGKELFALARENKVAIGFEASCAGGIPIIRALYDGLMANDITALYGIVNGTCNYILTEMIQKGQSYDAALSEAQADGLAEADPTLDVTGMDSAHKIAIMASLAFGKAVELDRIPSKGINNLELFDVKAGQELGYVVKLLAIAEKLEDGISLRVRPEFIPTDHPLAWVSGPFNAVSTYGHAVGHTMYYGRGAGALPTASAVVSDVISIARGTIQQIFETAGLWSDKESDANQLPDEAITSRYYLRLMVEDTSGVLAKITAILAEHNISISSVLQKELPTHKESADALPIVITTHIANEGNMMNALKVISSLDAVQADPVWVPILEEPEENIQ